MEEKARRKGMMELNNRLRALPKDSCRHILRPVAGYGFHQNFKVRELRPRENGANLMRQRGKRQVSV